MAMKVKSPATKAKESSSPSKLIDGRIKALGDWRGEMLAKVRAVIRAADPDVVEEWKWRGVPVFIRHRTPEDIEASKQVNVAELRDRSVLILDDVLATGGTLSAAAQLLGRVGAQVTGAAVVLELTALGGREAVAPLQVHSLCRA